MWYNMLVRLIQNQASPPQKIKKYFKKGLTNYQTYDIIKSQNKRKEVLKMKLLLIYVVLNVVNVLLQTVKSIATIKGGKVMSAVTNAIAYGLYTVVVVYMMCDLPLWLKATVIGLCNLVGVYIVKALEEKARKDKLWKVEMTVRRSKSSDLATMLDLANISYNAVDTSGIDTVFNVYSKTQNESKAIKELAKKFNAKYFVSESKAL